VSKSILIIAAEASSAHYAEQVMKHLKSQDPTLHFFGVGSKAMEDQGFECLGYSEDMAVVGVFEVVKHYPTLRRVFNSLVEQSNLRKPAAVLLMDYPEFNIRLAKALKPFNHRIFYYISPQVWAWRQSRIFDIKKYCEKVFLLFPFEISFYEQYQVPFEFVGHPLLDDLQSDLFDSERIAVRRSQFGIKKTEKVLLLMPGSRKGEIDRHLQVQLDAAEILLKKYPQLRLMIACAPSLSKDDLIEKMNSFKSPYLLLREDPNNMIALADLVLVASGTAALMVGLLEKPMVIIYKVSWLTGKIATMLTKHLRFFGLPNLVLNEPVIKELKQEEVTPVVLALELEKFLVDEKYVQTVVAQLKTLRLRLGEKGASKKVADHLWKVIRS
jgi:lipid-A-disaccharide synthase